MGILTIVILLTLTGLCSCANVGYLVKQGHGQFRLLASSRLNSELLSDPLVDTETKNKIKAIENYRHFFYTYLGRKKGEIYSRTTFLAKPEVSHLVIVSPRFKVEALKECFLLMGCFPYLGFFDEGDAQAYAHAKERVGNVTFVRPVYAYSTLGYFTDPILTSFLRYNEHDLSELIFHELLHTIFFIKDEVNLNESVAQYFGEEMAFLYFNYTGEKQAQMLYRKQAKQAQKKLVISLVAELNKDYAKAQKSGEKNWDEILNAFLNQRFYPVMEQECSKWNISRDKCGWLKRRWNNASFAAYLTYEGYVEQLANLRVKRGLDLKGFLEFLEAEYVLFKKSKKKDKEATFAQYLFKTQPEN